MCAQVLCSYDINVPLDRVPFSDSRIGTGCFFELPTLGTHLACILLIFQAIISQTPSHFASLRADSLKIL